MKRLHELVDLTVNDDHDLPDSDTIDLASSSDEDDQDELSSSIVKSFSKPGKVTSFEQRLHSGLIVDDPPSWIRHRNHRKRTKLSLSAKETTGSRGVGKIEEIDGARSTDHQIDLTAELLEEEEIDDIFEPRNDWTRTWSILDGNVLARNRTESVTSLNKFGNRLPKLTMYPENLDCLIEKYRHRVPLRQIYEETLDCSGIEWVEIDRHIENGMEIVAADYPNLELRDGNFIRVKKILENVRNDTVVLRGWKFHPTADLQPSLPAVEDEVCWVLEVDHKSAMPLSEACMVNVLPSTVAGVRQIHLTNDLTSSKKKPEKHSISKTGALECRWKLVIVYSDDKTAHERQTVEFALQAILEAEADDGHKMRDSDRRHLWRGPYFPLGQQYTFVDGFCGAGGTSAGARQAGLKVVRAFDIAREPLATFRQNFPAPETECYEESVDKYCSRKNMAWVDISHYSPCCQPWSAAHTVHGKDDEANEAASFCVENLLKIDRPRITTLENTSGLHSHHPDIMYALFGQYTAQGYSIRVRILNFADWGLPQPRRRLVLIGSSPGEPLPHFPEPTHASEVSVHPDKASLKPYVGLEQAIKPLEQAISLGIDLPNHEPWAAARIAKLPFAALQAKCVTCKGGENYHPSGERVLTVRELAVVQGFPVDYQFATPGGKTSQVKQIGNAFPALFTKQLFHSIIQQMRQTDGTAMTRLELEYSQSRPVQGSNGVCLWMKDTSPLEFRPLPL